MSSPTLSEMEFPLSLPNSPWIIDHEVTPSSSTAPHPPPLPPPALSPLGTPHKRKAEKKVHKDKSLSNKLAKSLKEQNEIIPTLTRYLTPNKDESFIGPLLSTIDETISLIKSNCPTLSCIPQSKFSLKLRFDGNTFLACENILFRILPETWPNALHQVLHLVHVEVDQSQSLSSNETRSGPSTFASQIHGGAENTKRINLDTEDENQSWSKNVGIRDEKLIVDGKSLTHEEFNDIPLLGVKGWTDKNGAKSDTEGDLGRDNDGSSYNSNQAEDCNDLTWDDLRENGTLLGIQGLTDRPNLPINPNAKSQGNKQTQETDIKSWDELRENCIILGIPGTTDRPNPPIRTNCESKNKQPQETDSTCWEELIENCTLLGVQRLD